MISANNDACARKCRDHVVPVPLVTGSNIEPEFRLSRDEKGNSIYTQVGEVNVSEYINSFKDGCSLESMLNRVRLMPTAEKVAFFQQTENGFSADLSNLPKDGTEAAILISKLGDKVPEFAARMKAGESFESLLKELIPNVAKESEKAKESEVNVDG